MLQKTVSFREGRSVWSVIFPGGWMDRHATHNQIFLQLLLSQLELHPKSWRISLLKSRLQVWILVGKGVDLSFFCWKIYVKRWCVLLKILSRNLAWNLKMMVSKRNLLFQGLLFGFHVKFLGGMLFYWTFGSGFWDGFCFIIMKMHEVMLNICRKKERWILMKIHNMKLSLKIWKTCCCHQYQNYY